MCSLSRSGISIKRCGASGVKAGRQQTYWRIQLGYIWNGKQAQCRFLTMAVAIITYCTTIGVAVGEQRLQERDYHRRNTDANDAYFIAKGRIQAPSEDFGNFRGGERIAYGGKANRDTQA
jgi:hypothetical protein